MAMNSSNQSSMEGDGGAMGSVSVADFFEDDSMGIFRMSVAEFFEDDVVHWPFVYGKSHTSLQRWYLHVIWNRIMAGETLCAGNFEKKIELQEPLC